MIVLVIILSILVVALAGYDYILRKDIKKINKRLTKRLEEDSHQLVSTSLINKEMEQLAGTINRCLKAEETLRLNAVHEEQAFKDMIANLSHDLRTPLTSVRGYLQLLDRTEMTNEQEEKLNIARKHVEELGELIEHFFEYSYYVNAPDTIPTERLNLTNLICDCLADAVPMFEEKGLKLNLLKQETIVIEANKEYTIRMVQNLIRNFLMHGKEELKIVIEKTPTDALTGTVHFINVIDAKDTIDVARLFERFYSSDTARKHSTGLGLSIVKILAEKMGGKVGATKHGNELDIWFSL